MADLRRARWADLTTDDFRGLDAARHVALLPIGAIEQHGPHLPLDTDTRIAEGIALAALERLPPGIGALLMPTQAIGSSDEHGAYPGTLSHPAETFIALLGQIGEGVARAGLRRLVVFNAHGGQPQMVDIAALRLRLKHRMLVVKANVFRFGMPAGLFDEAELRHGVHGGAVETSLMLHLCPERVRVDRAADFAPVTRRLLDEGLALGPGTAASFAWATQDLHVSGAVGNALAGDAAKGARLLTYYADTLAQVVVDAARFPLDVLKERP